MKTGKVYLVGAGPGDPGLITRKALECLSQADVIVFDDLVDQLLLDYTKPGAEKIYGGKRRGSHIFEQDKINSLLVKKAKQGNKVVRLKGGDPFVLGRGGEEAEFLRDNNIPFEIVPGVSSAIAVPAYAGIPVTHRHLASSFTVVTGHQRTGITVPAIDWKNLSAGTGTLVFLMGMQNLADIVKKLRQHGKKARTPVAVISDGTLPSQEIVTGKLDNIVQLVKAAALKAPGVIVVGDVVKLNSKLKWFKRMPLSGKCVLVTRPANQAAGLSKLLSACGAQPVELAAIEIQPATDNGLIDTAISHFSRYDWIVFTSTNGVEAFFQRLIEGGKDARTLKNCKVAAIGPATAAALKARGIAPDFMPEEFSGAGIIRGFKSYKVKGKKFLLPRSDLADKALTTGLRKMGAVVDDIAVYRTVASLAKAGAFKALVRSMGIDVITFTSASAVAGIARKLGKDLSLLNKTKVACIGLKTAEAVRAAGLKADIIAGTHTIPGLVSAIEEYFREEQ